MVFSRRYLAPVMALMLGAGSLSAEPAQQRRAANGAPAYDTSREVTVSGTATGIEVMKTPDGTRIILMLTADGKTLGVILGPEDWMAKQQFRFAIGAAAEVVGLPGYRYNGNAAMLPRTVTIAGKTLTLRDASGKALWEERAR